MAQLQMRITLIGTGNVGYHLGKQLRKRELPSIKFTVEILKMQKN